MRSTNEQPVLPADVHTPAGESPRERTAAGSAKPCATRATAGRFGGAILLAGLVALNGAACVGGPAPTDRGPVAKPNLSPYSFSARFRAAVLLFENKSGSRLNDRYMERIQEGLVARLLGTQRLRLIERSKINSLLKEHELAQKGIVDYKDAKKIGQMLSADALLLGSLSSIRATIDETRSIGRVTDYAVQVEMNGRLINVETSEVLASAIVRTRVAGQERSIAGMRQGTIDKRVIEDKAVQQAIDELAWKLAALIPKKN